MTTGYIHSVESFSTQDGPGIRYVVFMQGCPLRCKYCHNPDTWQKNKGEQISISTMMEKIKSCQPYFNKQGGVTISGGEPTLQIDFVADLLTACKEEGIHTALDTSGYVKQDEFKKLLPNLDLVLLDLKHLDDKQHQDLTGVSNQKTLDLIKLLESERQPYWIKHVIVPGITDDLDKIKELASYLKSLSYLKKVQLLPYHRLGVHKWEELGLDYQLSETEPPSEEKLEKIKEIIKQQNIKVEIK
ncbi:pyruvate formate-lyase-activating protein [Halanaerobacter jeridensis]|uniref:Pyruvate formate-lyase-activating enzyme n=1 Tax=Halanaerobacter jeridensis TaxID=706427 RepID=A0A939BPX3_9FIRM|nr:pyruvate formate-lyase-activating protein [Halanaerobacter jeridensis]MBM7557602.1 pyruvate formate lyase activating enzyme [Halanaerobacter jeridensis]